MNPEEVIFQSDYARRRWPDEAERRKNAAALAQLPFEVNGAYTYATPVTLGSDGENPWVQILPLGTITHPKYGDLTFTAEKLAAMARNFTAGIPNPHREIDLDYEHKRDPSKGTKAAGWIKAVEARDNGLFGQVTFTPSAAKEIKDGEWRYISAEFRDNWADNAGKQHKDVLFGAALTNRPFVKGMAPINLLSELLPGEEDIDLDGIVEGGEGEYDPYAFTGDEWVEFEGYVLPAGVALRDIPASERNQLPVGSFAGKNRSFPIVKCEDVGAAWTRVASAGPDNFGPEALRNNIIRIARAKGFVSCLPKVVQASLTERRDAMNLAELLGLSEDATDEQIEAAVKALVEFRSGHQADPEEERARKFAEDYPEEAAALAASTQALAAQRVDHTLGEWNRQGLPPALNSLVRGFMLGEDTVKLSDTVEVKPTFEEIISQITKTGMVPVKPSGALNDPKTFADPVEEIAEMSRKLAEEQKISYREARAKVAAENPELARAALLAAPKLSAVE